MTKIILTRYNRQELLKQAAAEPEGPSFQLLGDSLAWTYKQPSDEAFEYRASDGFQQIDVRMELAEAKKLSLFNMRDQLHPLTQSVSTATSRMYKCLFSNVTRYTFQQVV